MMISKSPHFTHLLVFVLAFVFIGFGTLYSVTLDKFALGSTMIIIGVALALINAVIAEQSIWSAYHKDVDEIWGDSHSNVKVMPNE